MRPNGESGFVFDRTTCVGVTAALLVIGGGWIAYVFTFLNCDENIPSRRLDRCDAVLGNLNPVWFVLSLPAVAELAFSGLAIFGERRLRLIGWTIVAAFAVQFLWVSWAAM